MTDIISFDRTDPIHTADTRIKTFLLCLNRICAKENTRIDPALVEECLEKLQVFSVIHANPPPPHDKRGNRSLYIESCDFIKLTRKDGTSGLTVYTMTHQLLVPRNPRHTPPYNTVVCLRLVLDHAFQFSVFFDGELCYDAPCLCSADEFCFLQSEYDRWDAKACAKITCFYRNRLTVGEKITFQLFKSLF